MRNFKEDFPLLRNQNIAYLDNAATTQRPDVVLDAIRNFYETANANPLRGLYELGIAATDSYEASRERTARFIHAARPEEIVFTRNTTESINLVMYSYALSTLKPGDEIVITISEHHSNILPWQAAARQTGATLKYMDCEPDGSFSEETMDAAITPRTKIAAVCQISNVLGRVSPVDEIIRRVHAVGGVVLVDAAQSAPHMPIDVQAMDVDFLAFSAHKMFGPMGVGVLYGKYDLLDAMPPFLTGGEMIDTVTREGAVYAAVPHKFEAGTVNAAGAAGLAAALDYIDEIGWDTIEERERALTKQAFEGLAAIPHLHILGSQKAEDHHGIISFVVDGVHPHDISSILDEAKVDVRAGHHCAQPLLAHLGLNASVRASMAFYNTEDDVERLVDTMKTVRRLMGYAE